MAETVDQIEAHIGRTRERLGSNLRELERKVDAATDWREHYRAHPYAMLGAACLGGALLGLSIGRPSRSGAQARSDLPRRGFDAGGQISDFWDDITTALIGVASAAVKDHIAEWVPGFNEQFDRASQRAGRVAAGGDRR
jgi:hypothetical protein